ncbi:peptide chain release factor N(5)-glutamine methyltransferase [Desulfohalovibrio reitneri]|uniref:peptide chain release factor N(5)-glutamine methyltransferase n=1 Tax=Desulfohalovibrio reitneri TaxID=1307759 RepID=UPI0004A72D56|nr:peptide chain release factor N(5)-glutamine methyltransferase [Desulfohalovibrio reitneri]
METVGGWLRSAEAELIRGGADAPRLAAGAMLAHVLGLDRTGLFLARERNLSKAERNRADELLARRASGEPLAYVLGEREFYGLTLRVTPDVLIPRPDTETIVDEARGLFDPSEPLTFADLGTGSGALAAALACLFPLASGVAMDRSPGALDVARDNLQRLKADSRVACLLADFADLPLASDRLDLVVANPPYVTNEEFACLPPGVGLHEPRGALEAGEDGLDCVRALLPEAARALRPGGWLLMEMGASQGAACLELARGAGLVHPVIRKDLAGLDRVLCAKSPE